MNDSRDASSIGLAVVIAAVLLIAGLEAAGRVEITRVLEWWPAVVAIFGVALLKGNSELGEPRAGWLLLAAGALIMAVKFDQWSGVSLDLSQLWPLALVAAGAIIVWRSFDGHSA